MLLTEPPARLNSREVSSEKVSSDKREKNTFKIFSTRDVTEVIDFTYSVTTYLTLSHWLELLQSSNYDCSPELSPEMIFTQGLCFRIL